MAPVTCPKCKKVVNTSSNKCPNCGGMLKVSAFDKNAPKHAKFHMVSNVLLAVSCILLFIEFMSGTKTYAGGLLFGAGFLFQGLSLLEKEKEKGYSEKKRGKIIVVISFFLILAGGLYLYLDLR